MARATNSALAGSMDGSDTVIGDIATAALKDALGKAAGAGLIKVLA